MLLHDKVINILHIMFEIKSNLIGSDFLLAEINLSCVENSKKISKVMVTVYT